MEAIKLFDSELKVMEVLWERGQTTAKELSMILQGSIGWNKNTTYTIIKKLVDKNIIEREDPGFLCRPLIKRSEVQMAETKNLIERLYHGSKKMFFAAFLQQESLSEEEIKDIKNMIDQYEKDDKSHQSD